MIPSPAPTARCSALGTSWPQLEGSLRTWHCWWVCGGQGSGRTQGEGPSPCDSGTLMCCVQGGAISIHVLWDCNLDTGGSDCQPHYSFQLQQKSYNFRCHCPRPQCPHAAPQPGAPSPVLLWRSGQTPLLPSPLDALLCVRGWSQEGVF